MSKASLLNSSRLNAPLLLIGAGILFMIIAVLIVLRPTSAGGSIVPARIGQPLASLSLVDTNGQTRQLTDYSGKVILLNI